MRLLPLMLSFSLDEPARGWLDGHTLPLRSVEAGTGFEDLRPLGAHIGDARVVALGECTHGSREVFQLKHRLTEYLAVEKGFSVFGIEASLPDTLEVDAYVHGADLDSGKVVRGMGFWTWSTEEVRTMATWMRAQNQVREVPLQWWGFDLQNPSAGLARLEGMPIGDEALAQVRTVKNELGAVDFAATGLRVPGSQAAGRALVLSGRIRTQDVEGWAGLWVRVEGPDGKVLAFDNMSKRGPRGTQGWKTWTVEMRVPVEADHLVFGVVRTGTGSSWFDDLHLRLDGQTWTPPEGVDLGFEHWDPQIVPWARQAIAGDEHRWVSGGSGFEIAPDPQVGGLRIQAEQRPTEAREAAQKLATDLESRAAQDISLALAARLARTVVQGLDMANAGRGGSAIRDQAMADNVLWLLEHTDAKLVLWAHNLHVSREEGWMGAHLAAALGKDYLPLGFACGAGTYSARDRNGDLGEFRLRPPPKNSVEHALDTDGRGSLLLDLREATEPAAAWLQRPLALRDIGALAKKRQFSTMNLPQAFDLLVYLDQTRAAVPLPWPAGP